MKLNFENLEEIRMTVEYVFPPEHISRMDYSLTIYPDGGVQEDEDDYNTSRYYKADKKDVEQLYNRINDFIDEAVTAMMIVDDTARSVTLNYGFINISIDSNAVNKDNVTIGGIIEDFLNDKCKEVSKEEF